MLNSIRPRIFSLLFRAPLYPLLFASLALLSACGGSYGGGNGNGGGGGSQYDAPVISSTAPPDGTVNAAYSFTFTITSGGKSPFTWSETGALPTGLTLGSGGKLSGTPTASGSFPITVKVTDSASQAGTQNFTLTLTPPSPPPAACPRHAWANRRAIPAIRAHQSSLPNLRPRQIPLLSHHRPRLPHPQPQRIQRPPRPNRQLHRRNSLLRRRHLRAPRRPTCNHHRRHPRLSASLTQTNSRRRLLRPGHRQHLHRISPLRRPHHLGAHGPVGRPAVQHSPGNLYSDVKKIHLDPAAGRAPNLSRSRSRDPARRDPRRHAMGQAHQNSKQAAHQILGPSHLYRRHRPAPAGLRRASRRLLPGHLRTRPLRSSGSASTC